MPAELFVITDSQEGSVCTGVEGESLDTAIPGESDTDLPGSRVDMDMPEVSVSKDMAEESAGTHKADGSIAIHTAEGSSTDTPERCDTDTQDGSADTGKPEGYANRITPEGSIDTDTPEESVNADISDMVGSSVDPDVPGPINTEAPETLDLDTPENSVDAGTPEGSINTGTREKCFNTHETVGSVEVDVPEGSVNTGTPEGSISRDTPQRSADPEKPGKSVNTDMLEASVDVVMQEASVDPDTTERSIKRSLSRDTSDSSVDIDISEESVVRGEPEGSVDGSIDTGFPEGSAEVETPEGVDMDVPEGIADGDEPHGFVHVDMPEGGAESPYSAESAYSRMPRSKVDLDMPGSEVDVDMPGSEVDVDVPGSEVDLDVPGSEVDLDVPGSEVDLDVPGSEVDLDMPGSEVDLDVAGSEVDLDMPGSEVDLDVPGSDVDLDVPGSEVDLDVPGSEVDLDVLGSEVDIDMPDGLSADVPTMEIPDTLTSDTVQDSVARDSQQESVTMDTLQDSVAMDTQEPATMDTLQYLVAMGTSRDSVVDTPQDSVAVDAMDTLQDSDTEGKWKIPVDMQDSVVMDTQHDSVVMDTPQNSVTIDTPQASVTMDSRRNSFIMETFQDSVVTDTPRDSVTIGTVWDSIARHHPKESAKPCPTAGLVAKEACKEPVTRERPTEWVSNDVLKNGVSLGTQMEPSPCLSMLSPFAEPFMPRDSGHVQPQTTGVSSMKHSLPPPLAQSGCHWTYAGPYLPQYTSNMVPEGSQGQQKEAHSLNLLLESSYQRMFPPRCFEEAPTLAGSRLQQVIENRNKIEGPSNAPSWYFDRFTSTSQPLLKVDILPVGYERARKDHTEPPRVNTLSDQTSRKSATSSGGLPIHQLFSNDFGSDSGGLISKGSNMINLPTEKTNGESFTRSQEVLSKNGALPENCISVIDSVSTSKRRTAESDQGLKRNTSCIGSWTVNEQSEKHGGIHRTVSNPELHKKADRAVLLPKVKGLLGNHGDVWTETDLLEPTDLDDNVSDGDETLLAEGAVEGNALIDFSAIMRTWDGRSVRKRLSQPSDSDNAEEETPYDNSVADDREESRQTQASYSISLSTDSGIGSLSDHSAISLLKADSDSDGSPKPSPPRPRLCGQHSRELTMYCADSCQMLCHLCRADHVHCGRVLNISLACRDLRCRLLKIQSRVDTYIHSLNETVEELQPEVDGLAACRVEAKTQAKDQFEEIRKDLHASHERHLKEIDEDFTAMKRGATEKIQKAEQTLAMLNYVNKFIEVLRHQDSGWDLLSTFDQRLNLLLEKVVHTAESNLDYIRSLQSERQKLRDCQKVAYSIVRHLVGSEWTDDLEDQPGNELGSTLNTESDTTEGWSFKRSSDQPENADLDWKLRDSDETSNITEPIHSDSYEKCLVRELREYLQRCSKMNGSHSATASLYTNVMKNLSILSPTDVYDDVFFSESQPHSKTSPSDIFASQTVTECSQFKVHQRLSTYFPQDREKAFVTDLHITETGLLVCLDAANFCLKRYDLRQVSRLPVCLQVPQPLSMCSAGWDRVMVSSARRALGIYSVGGQQMQLVMPRSTPHQYRGLVRASDSLVAAACPETRSVDLLDLAGRALRSIMPVDFFRGPEVVGVTKGGKLLVVHQPATPPTTLVCFDMSGKVQWSRALHTPMRHVSVCKVVGAADGQVYLALQGDSVLYRLDPATGRDTVLLNTRAGIKFPSSLALTEDGKVMVTRNELPNLHSGAANSAPMLPTTTEIDVFVRVYQRSNNTA